MSISHEWTPQGLIARFSGCLTLNDLIFHIDEVVRPMNLSRGKRALSDFSGVTELSINACDVAEYARLEVDFLTIRDVQHDIRVGIVHTCPEIAQLVDVFVGNQRFSTMTIARFASFDEAYDWVFGEPPA